MTTSLKTITRINVVGTSGSGKSTFTKRLAQQLNCKAIEIDALHWRANWQHISEQELLVVLERELAAEKWVLDGNYTKTIPVKWQRVQMVVWLDYSFVTTLFQMVKRSFSRIISREKLWYGNTETFWKLFTKDSIVWYMITTYYPNRKKYNKLIEDKAHGHIQFVRLKSPREAEKFLKEW